MEQNRLRIDLGEGVLCTKQSYHVESNSALTSLNLYSLKYRGQSMGVVYSKILDAAMKLI